MAETLKPCPLCGSTDIACFAEDCGDNYDNVPVYRVVVGCCGCREEGCDPSYDEEPCFGIEAYFRADHPLIKDEEDPEDCERVLERHMAERWNLRAERTCHVATKERRFSKTQTLVTKSCSACGYAFGDEERRPILPGLDETMVLDPVHVPSYCPHCGARVVEVSE